MRCASVAAADAVAPDGADEHERATAEDGQQRRAREHEGQHLVDVAHDRSLGPHNSIVADGAYSTARLAPGWSTGVSPFGAAATGWAKSAGVSPILIRDGCG